MKEYALYKGEECLAIGTIKEIAKKMNVKERTIYFEWWCNSFAWGLYSIFYWGNCKKESQLWCDSILWGFYEKEYWWNRKNNHQRL